MAFLPKRCGVIVNNSVRILISDADYAAVELYKDYPEGLLTFAFVCCAIFMIIGIPGNFITLVALVNYKKVHNATAMFIMSISCMDMLLLCIAPPSMMSTYWSRSWTHGRVLCQLYTLAKNSLIGGSVFTVLAITTNRYILIMHPRLYCKFYRKQNLVIMIVALWLAPLIILTPTYLGIWGCFGLDPHDGSCSIVPDQNNVSPKLFLFISVLGLPCIPIFICYARIFRKVRRTLKKSKNKKERKTLSTNIEVTSSNSSSVRFAANDNGEEEKEIIPLGIIASLNLEHSKSSVSHTPDGTNDETCKDIIEPSEQPKSRRNILKRSIKFIKMSLPRRKDKRLGTMIVAIIATFCLCYLPTAFIVILHEYNFHPILNIAAHTLQIFSCCINPVVYVVMSNEYHKAYNNLFKCRLYSYAKKSLYLSFINCFNVVRINRDEFLMKRDDNK